MSCSTMRRWYLVQLHAIIDNVNVEVLWCHPLNNSQLKDMTYNLVPMYSVSPLKCRTHHRTLLYFTRRSFLLYEAPLTYPPRYC